MSNNPAARPAPAEPPRVGAALAALRERQGLSLDELSRRAGVSKSMLSQIERAQANPTVAVVWRLAQALGVPLADLLQSADAPAVPAIDSAFMSQGAAARMARPTDCRAALAWRLRYRPKSSSFTMPATRP